MASPKRPPAPKPDAPAPAVESFPTIGVIERRIKSGKRNAHKALDIHLVGQPEPMTVRTINAAIPGRWYQAIHELGWVPITAKEVAGGLHGDLREVDGQVMIGDPSSKEILVKMPTRLYNAVQRSKQETLDRQQTSRSAFASRVVQSLERDAKSTDRAGAESLERQAEAMDGRGGGATFHLDEFATTTEHMPLGEP